MLISPNSFVYILKGVNLSPDYVNTVYFKYADAQYNYFVQKAVHKLTNQTYVRVEEGVIQVELTMKDLLGCDYLMFNNSSYGNNTFEGKWFYAFITNIEYVNTESTRIHFQLDVMQSWITDYKLPMCYVEREHTADDTIGTNTVPENLNIGDYICTGTTRYGITSTGLSPTDKDDKIFIVVSEPLKKDDGSIDIFLDDDDIELHTPDIVCGTPLNCFWYEIKLGNVNALNSREKIGKIYSVTGRYATSGKADAIICIFMCPDELSNQFVSLRRTFDVAPRRLTVSSVKNNKLFTYPYCYLELYSNKDVHALKYELLDTNKIRVIGSFGSSPAYMAFPDEYSGQKNYIMRSVTVSDFPVLCWISDYFQNWYAQNKASISQAKFAAVTNAGANVLSALGMILATVATVGTGGAAAPAIGAAAVYATGSAINSVVNASNQIESINAQVENHSVTPDTFNGSIEAANCLWALKELDVWTRCLSIKPEYIEIIDDYFSMYGYATHKVKTPNINVRERWTYVKTVGMAIKDANVPAQDIVKINQIYDKGITFWRSTATIGDYSQRNNIDIQN